MTAEVAADFAGKPSHAVVIVEPLMASRVGHIGPNVEGMARLLKPIPVRAYGSTWVKSGFVRDNLAIEGLFRRSDSRELLQLEKPDGSGCLEGMKHILDALGPSDHMLLPGAVPPTINALCTLLASTPPQQIPSIVLRFFDVGQGGLPQNQTIPEAVRRLRSNGALWRRTRIFTELPEQAQHVRKAWGVKAEWFPHVPPSCFLAPASVAERPAGTPFRIGLFGNGRAEKGLDRLPDIIRAFHRRAEPRLSGKVRWIVHASGLGAQERQALEPVATLARANPGIVEIVADSLGQADYDAMFRTTDILALPYFQEPYRLRGSGIATEACYAGRPYVYTSGTALGSMTGGGAIACSSAFAFADGLIEICRNYDTYAERMRAAGDAIRAQAAGAGYIAALSRPALAPI
jgi:hypothetical protein